MKLDGLIIIGGDGSMQILKKLAKDGDMKIVAIPKTIDNDVGATESSIGFHPPWMLQLKRWIIYNPQQPAIEDL